MINKVRNKIRNFSASIDQIDQKLNRTDYTLNNICVSLEALNNEAQIIKDSIEQSSELISLEYATKLLRHSPKKLKVLVCGYYGARNLGDEFMLQSLIKRLPKNLDVTIMIANNRTFDASFYLPYRTIHYPKTSSDYEMIAEYFDVIIWGGGAVIDDRHYEFRGIYNDLSYILLHSTMAMLNNRKQALILGVSSNRTIQRKDFIKDLQEVIDRSAFFSLRDTNSLGTLEKSGIRTSKIKVIDDLALADLPKLLDTTSKKNNVCITYIMNDDNIQYLTDSTKNILSVLDENIKITFIPFYDEKNHDEIYYQKIVESMPEYYKKRFFIESFPTDVADFYNKVSNCNLFISMRYHGVLVSSICSVPTLSINYGSNHQHYFNKMKYIKDQYVPSLVEISYEDLDDEKILNQKIKNTISTLPHISHNLDLKKIQNNLNKILEHYLV